MKTETFAGGLRNIPCTPGEEIAELKQLLSERDHEERQQAIIVKALISCAHEIQWKHPTLSRECGLTSILQEAALHGMGGLSVHL